MGVRQWMQRQKFNDPVPGTFEVQTSETGKWGVHVDVNLSGMLRLPGLATLPADYRGKVPESKVPVIGQILPATVDRADPNQFRIEWDQVPTVTQRGAPEDLADADVPVSHAHTAAPDWDLATATVLTCHTAKVPTLASDQAPGGIVDLTVNVRLSDGYEYGTKARVAFSTLERRARATEKGTELPVRVDPADPNRIVIDIDRIPHW